MFKYLLSFKSFCLLFILFCQIILVAQKAPLLCDTTLWKHVVHPEKFVTDKKCITVTGKIVSLEIKKDGDEHILLKPDGDYKYLLNERNMKKMKGCLVVEIICVYKSGEPDARAACSGYTNKVAIPRKGEHVSVTGTYVQDEHHSWMEIHPVSSISLLEN